MRVAIYPGTFDPLTLGHLDLIQRASQQIEKLFVLVAANEILQAKSPMFSTECRVKLIQEAVASLGLKNIEVRSFSGLVSQEARQLGVKTMIRGVRNPMDLEYERQLAFMNQAFYPGLETLFLLASPSYSHINSSIVREILKLIKSTHDSLDFSHSLSALVPESVLKFLSA